MSRSASHHHTFHFLGKAYLLAGKYETAVPLLRQRIGLVPETDFSRAALVFTLGHLGEVDEARRIWRELEEVNPVPPASAAFRPATLQETEDVQRVIDGPEEGRIANLSLLPERAISAPAVMA